MKVSSPAILILPNILYSVNPKFTITDSCKINTHTIGVFINNWLVFSVHVLQGIPFYNRAHKYIFSYLFLQLHTHKLLYIKEHWNDLEGNAACRLHSNSPNGRRSLPCLYRCWSGSPRNLFFVSFHIWRRHVAFLLRFFNSVYSTVHTRMYMCTVGLFLGSIFVVDTC